MTIQGNGWSGMARSGLVLLVIAAVALGVFLLPRTQGSGDRVLAAPAHDVAPARTITVDAIGQVQAVPDVGIVSVGVQTKRNSAQDALQATNQVAQQILTSILKLGIPSKDVQTSDVSLFPNTDSNGRPNGYTASTTFSVKAPLDKVGAVIDTSSAAGANQIGGVSFDIRNDSTVQAQALTAALKAARLKADAIAGQVGVSVRAVRSVSTVFAASPVPVAQAAAAPRAASVPIQGGQLTVTAQVTVTYDF